MEPVKSISSSPIVSPLQRGGSARYTHNILLYFNKKKPIPFLLAYRDMSSINIVNDALCAMTAEQTEDVSFFSSLDNTVSSKPRTVYFLFDGLQLNITCPQGGSPLPDS